MAKRGDSGGTSNYPTQAASTEAPLATEEMRSAGSAAPAQSDQAPPGFVRMWPFGSDVNALTVDGEEYVRAADGSFLIRSEHVGAAHTHYLTEKLDAG